MRVGDRYVGESSRRRSLAAALSVALAFAPAFARGEAPAASGPRSDLWSLKPVTRTEPPPARLAEWSANPIDRFVLAQLDEEGFEPAPPAARDKLARRLYFDLWGLPPSPEELQAFLDDTSAEAYERLVDKLLASPRFGERWARYWLDVVRFAETNGYERDALKPHAWKYRDWTIAAFNDDKPYDRFVLEQLAGDELPDADAASRIATGFLRVGTFDDEPNDPLQYKFEQLDDLMHATGSAFLGLTVKCARCHDHKFDPIPQTDYYSLLNCFSAGKAAEGDWLGFTDQGREMAPVKLLVSGDPRREGPEAAPGFLSLLPELARPVAPPAEGAATTQRRLQLARWIVDPANPLTPRVFVNRLWQHHFGMPLARTPDNFGNLSSPPTNPRLLDWLAAELVSGGWKVKRLHKSMVMSTAYRMDSVHPRELEYRNRDFVNENLWRAHRQRLDAEALRDNMLAVSGELNLKAGGPSFFPPASKEALEGLSKKSAAWGVSPPEEQRRRSIYMYTQRSLLTPLMTTFDFIDTTQPCGERNVTTVAPQALALLNNEFVHQQSTAFAERVAREAGADVGAQIDRAWRLALGRAPADEEATAAREHVTGQQARFAANGAEGPMAARLALVSLCHVLLNSNEFVYVD